MAVISKISGVVSASIAKVIGIAKASIETVAGVFFTTPAPVDIAVGHNNTPYITAYPWSSGFGTKYSDPGTTPASTGQKIRFSQ